MSAVPSPPPPPNLPLPPSYPPAPGTETDIAFGIICLATAALILIFLICFVTNSNRPRRKPTEADVDTLVDGSSESYDEYNVESSAFKMSMKLPMTPVQSLFPNS